jgi:predicted DNA-binding transcriptional regulator AlpA
VSESKTAKHASPAAQIALAKKAAALKATNKGQKPGTPAAIITAKQRHLFRAALVAEAIADRKDAEANGHPPRAPPSVLLLSKTDIVGITGVTYPTIWKWMNAGTFPRSRVVGGKAMWRSDDVKAWFDALPMQTLKCDKQKEEAEAAA